MSAITSGGGDHWQLPPLKEMPFSLFIPNGEFWLSSVQPVRARQQRFTRASSSANFAAGHVEVDRRLPAAASEALACFADIGPNRS
jgi:hypothetical protein